VLVTSLTSVVGRWRKCLAREEGQALVFVAGAMLAILGFVGLAIDSSHAFVNHKQMQTAADAAALAGAYDIVHGNPASVGSDVQKYARANGYDGPDLSSRTCTSSTDSNCWAYPYVDKQGHVHASAVEVRIHSGVKTFFSAFIHINFINVKTRAVASLVAGQETPQYSFVALQSDGENHTLLVKNSTTLNVANSLYTNSCGANPGCQNAGSVHDSFDVFGSGGTITDAHDIFVVGGWETHDGDFVGANGGTCIIGTSAGPYSPSVKTKVPLTTGTLTFGISGVASGPGPVAVNDVIQINNEQMLVTAVSGTGASVTLTVTRGYNSTPIVAHAVNTVINKLAIQVAPFNPSISTPAGGVNATDTTFNVSGTPSAVDPGDVIQIGSEQMQVVSVDTTLNSLTVVRGFNGTTAANHAAGVVINEVAAPSSVSAPGGTPQGGFCPIVGQPYLPDPFALFPSLIPGAQAWGTLPVSISKISRGANGNAAGVAEAVTSGPTGLSVGDQVTIAGVGSGFDGTFAVTSVSSPTDFKYSNGGPNMPSITGEQLSGGVVTVAVNSLFSPFGGPVTVSGLGGVFNVTNATATGVTANNFSYNAPTDTLTVTKEVLSGGVATLTVGSTADLDNNDTVNVNLGAGSPFNGTWTITVVNGTTFTYVDNATTTNPVTQKAIATGGGLLKATLTVNNNFVNGNQVTANLSPPDSRFDGTQTITARNNTSITYTIPAVAPAVTNKSVAGGVVTLTTSPAPQFETGDTVAVALGRLAYDNATATVGTVSGSTFTYTSPTFQNSGNPSWTKSGNSITVNMASQHAVHVGDNMKVTGAPVGAAPNNGSCSTGGTNPATFPVTAATTTAPFTFTYTVPATCLPGVSGKQQYTIQLWDAAASATTAPATATLVTMPAVATGGTVTGPANINTNVAGTANVTATPLLTRTGLFTPAWMPTIGTAQNAAGSPTGPTPLLISTSRTLLPGTYYGGICLGSANGVDCAASNCAVASTTTPYSPPVQLNAAINATQTTFAVKWTGGTDPVAANDVIQIGSEQMLVTIAPATTSPATLTVQRGYSGTTAAAAARNAAVTRVPPPSTPPTVHLQQGEYIMAGGGFHVCGNMALDAPNVLIYNTNDPSAPAATYGKVGQIEINTTGTVTLGPQTLDQDPLYAGFTIFEDRAQVVDPATFTPIAYNPAQSLAASIGATDPTFNTTGATPTVYPGNVISVGTELMMVTAVVNHTGSATLTVTRGYDGTTPAAHAAGVAVKSVTYGGDTCDAKAGKALGGDHTKMDISFLGAGSAPGGFPLDNISGTIYAAGPRADFENAMFGDANLAVITSCIFVDGGAVPPGLPAADFEFNPDNGNNIAGVDEALSE
jgi:hypothetical protein